jgi:VanZ family protein
MRNNFNEKIINITYSVLQTLLIIAFIAKKEYFSVIAAVFIFILYLLFLFYEHRNGIVIIDFIRISVLVSVLSSSFLGEYLGLYKTSSYFDKVLHIFGTFSFSVFIFSIPLTKGYFQGTKRSFIFIFIFLIGVFIGTFFEIGEFICDLIFKTTNQKGLIDTDLDMISNMLGGALGGIFVACQKHKLKHTP